MSIFREVVRAIRLTLVLWVLTAVIYPFLMVGLGQVLFPFQANGSLVQNLQGQPVGSALIGQVFTSERYFQSRPSTVDYSQGEKAGKTGISGASNLAPSNPELLKRIQGQATQLQQSGIQPIADLVYTSGSGLDPHITLEAAQTQLDRVAKARNLSSDEIVPLINKHTQGRFLGIFGEPGVNVLNLNRELDVLQAAKQ
jgi:K+-transporting ATPase ATPase C chain